ncbi:RraA family protein [Marinivivus vitaminiproducens]|uniref:RraA family protein n=1 Tax=Marinivivus vitaminiproducens TaxID=3035935 RepID=UPI00279F9FBE|nr:RraA family protein [Geminicoccaceae bacterium SCSIO 64248]
MKKYQIGPWPAALDPSLVEAARSVEIATIGHFRHRGFMATAMSPLGTVRGTLVGRAVTVAIPGPCSTLLHHAIGLLGEGDMLVIDRLGDGRHACLGGGVARAIARTGAIGAIVGGPCTDPDEIAESGLSVWCTGIAPITTRLLDLGGSLNLPIACGGVPVMPGDVVLADSTGVLVMPPGEALEAADEARTREARSQARQAKLAKGMKLGDLSGASRMVQADQDAAS